MSKVTQLLYRIAHPRAFALIIAVLALAAPAMFGAFSTRAPLRAAKPAQAAAAIKVDKVSYLAGETITISGSGFTPLESVMLQVKHADGTTERDMGHEPIWVYPDADGTFQATWNIKIGDSAGTKFVVAANGSSGGHADATFSRTATVSVNPFRSHSSGESRPETRSFRVTGAGFNPNEPVSIQVNGEVALTSVSNDNGQLTASLEVGETAAALSIIASGPDSGVSALTTIDPNWFVVQDLQGANDQPGQVDLTQLARRDDDPSFYKLLWNWDSISAWTGTGQTGDACALFTTDSDSNVNYVVCLRVSNPNANPSVVNILPAGTNKPAYFFQCGNAKPDRCTQPSPLTYSPGQILAGPYGAASQAGTGNLVKDTDPFSAGESYPNDTMVEVHIDKTLIPGNEVLTNVCSYPSAGNGGNNNPFDCILNPGDGLLKITKDAGINTTTDFSFTVGPPSPSLPQPSTYTLKGGQNTGNIGIAPTSTLKVTENIPSSWDLSNASCTLEGGTATGTTNTSTGVVSNIQIQPGKLTSCTFVNAPEKGTLIITKTVINDNGGTKTATDFGFQVDGGATVGFSQDGTDTLKGKNTLSLDPGTYTVTEPSVAGYSTSYSNCTSITVTNGGSATCAITNNDQPATLTVTKTVVNDSGGSKIATNFSFTVNGGGAISFSQDGGDTLKGKNVLTVNAGTYNVLEPAVSGYTTSYSSCSNIVLPNGGSATCAITNNDVAATLHVIKHVINDNGGTKSAGDFTLNVTGSSPSPSSFAGAESPGTTVTLNAGSYSVDETELSGYTKSLGTDCSGSIANGETKTCTITNNDQPGTLIIKKIVINDNGGTKKATDFSFLVNNAGQTSFLQDTDDLHGKNTLTKDAGTYNITEPAVSGYTTTYDNCSNVALTNGGTQTCTITNDDDKNAPDGSTVQRWVLHDKATFTILAGAPDKANAKVRFRLYSVPGGNVNVNVCVAANQVGTYEEVAIANGGATNGQATTVTGFAVDTPGTYTWTAEYTGDQFNQPKTTTCGDEITRIQIQ